jgi:hypothetical protein
MLIQTSWPTLTLAIGLSVAVWIKYAFEMNLYVLTGINGRTGPTAGDDKPD